MAAPSSNNSQGVGALFQYPPAYRMGLSSENCSKKMDKDKEIRAQLGTHFGLKSEKSICQGPNKVGSNFANPSQIARSTWVELGFARKSASPELCKVFGEKNAFSGQLRILPQSPRAPPQGFSGQLRTSQLSPRAPPQASSTPSRIGVNPGLFFCPLIPSFFPQVGDDYKKRDYQKSMGLTIKTQNVTTTPRCPTRVHPCVSLQEAEDLGAQNKEERHTPLTEYGGMRWRGTAPLTFKKWKRRTTTRRVQRARHGEGVGVSALTPVSSPSLP